MSLFAELKRRNVLRLAAFYIVAGWLILQVGQLLFEVLAVPEWGLRMVLAFLVIGFPITLIIAWIYEVTSEGVKRQSEIDRDLSITHETGKRLDIMTIVLLLGVAGLFLIDKLVHPTFSDQSPEVAITPPDPPDGPRDEGGGFESGVPPAPEKTVDRSVAVLPFVAMSSGEDDEYFADGLTEEILNSLASLPDLLVTARTSAFAFKGRNIEIPQIAESLGVAHVVEGSVRRSGDRLRITAQLVRADDGFHLWSDSYDRTIEHTFAVQEDIAANIARALDIVLDDAKRADMMRVGTRDVDAFISFQKGRELYRRAHADLPLIPTLTKANEHFGRAIEKEPFARAYSDHSDLHGHILLAAAAGEDPAEMGVDDIGSELKALHNDLDRAIELARVPHTKANVAISRRVFSDDWLGLLQQIESMTHLTGCLGPGWGYITSAVGGAEYMEVLFDYLRDCDPLNELGWAHASLAALWTGNATRAEAIAREGLQRLKTPVRVRTMLALSLMAQGDLDPQDPAILAGRKSPEEPLDIWTVALEGAIEADEVADRIEDDATRLLVAAITGHRDRANNAAALIDSRPLGTPVLLIATYLCACGAPFDIEHAPNLKNRLAEAELDWPPSTPINYPTKDW